MTEHDDLPSPRPPVLLGCVTALAALVFLFGIGSCLVVYWESGADTGKVRLELAEAYGPGTVQFVGTHNLYIARLPGGAFLALADLDRYRGRLSTEARGSTLIFREDCNGALYDFTGIRLDADGPNLDRYPTSIDTDGYLVVDTSRRTCTVRSGPAEAVQRPCDPR
jgi:hypothetical protein